MNSADLKRRNEALLRGMGFEVNPHLPGIEPLESLAPRSPQTVAARALLLGPIIGTGFGKPPADASQELENMGLTSSLTDAERAHLLKTSYTDGDLGWAQWLVQALYALAWCLDRSDTLDPLSDLPEDLYSTFGQCSDTKAFIASARLRPIAEIYEHADLYYRAHWAATDARLTGSTCPVVESSPYMRRWALDWVIGLPYEWDDVPHDT